MVWTDYNLGGGDTSELSVRSQRFNADGSTAGGEFLVNTTTFGVQQRPDITALENVRFVVTWTDGSQSSADTAGPAIFGQVFDANGAKHGAEFLVNTTTALDQTASTVTGLPDGRFVVAWRDDSQTGADTSGAAIRAQLFNANGTATGAEIVVPTTVIGFQIEPCVAAMADGRFVVTLTDFSLTAPDVSGFAVRGQIFDARTAAISLNGTATADDYLGTKFADSLKGGMSNDLLSGAGGNDTILGGVGADTFIGGGGADDLRGSSGKDVLTGGGGPDRFIFATAAEVGNGATRDRITDFTSGADKITSAPSWPGAASSAAPPFLARRARCAMLRQPACRQAMSMAAVPTGRCN